MLIDLGYGYTKEVEQRGWGVEVPCSCDAYQAWKDTPGCLAYDAITLVFETREQAEAWPHKEPRRPDVFPAYFVDGPQGFVVHGPAEQD